MSRSARAILRSLRAGIVPGSILEELSVGHDGFKKLIEKRTYDLRRGSDARPLFILGEWGTGKTHLLSLACRIAERQTLASALVSLNARSMALSRPQLIYPAIARNLRVNGRTVGLLELLAEVTSDRVATEKVISFTRRGLGDRAFLSALATACRMESGKTADGWDEDRTRSVLLGGDVAWSDYSYKREIAIQRIRTLTELLYTLGFGGLLLALDEVETFTQLYGAPSRRVALETLGSLLSVPRLLCVLGITERFGSMISEDLERGALDDRMGAVAAFVGDWQRRNFDIAPTPSIGPSDARKVADRIAKLHSEAYGSTAESGFSQRVVLEWSRNPFRNFRRLIRLSVHALDIRGFRRSS